MSSLLKLGSVSALALTLAAMPVLAQVDLVGITSLDDRIDDINTAVADDMARSEDVDRFGNPESRPGMSGSASLSYVGKTGATDS